MPPSHRFQPEKAASCGRSASALQRNEKVQVVGAEGLGYIPSQLTTKLGAKSQELWHSVLFGSQPA